MSAVEEQKPRVLFFVAGLDVGGAERHTLDLRARLMDRGWDTRLMVYGPRTSQAMREMPGARDPVLLNLKGMSDLRGWGVVAKALKAQDVDLILGINQAPAIVTTLLRVFGATKAKVGCVFHTTLLRPDEEKRLPLFKFAASMMDLMIYVSANQARYWAGRGLNAKHNATIQNGVDASRFTPSEDSDAAKVALGLDPEDVVIGMLAAFRPEKNHEQAVEALALARARGMRAKLLCVGDGPTRPRVEELAASLGVSEHVVFAGEQRNVKPFVAAFDVGLLSSLRVETFSLAALEALASGVPMVMSDIGGASEIVEDGVNGYLFEAGDMDALVDRLCRFSDPELRRAMKARARPSVERYSIEAMVSRYERLLIDTAGKPSRS
ncbi:glycosyltransferase [Caulobacter segnis]|uniref:Glycosyl transferase group 1 n=1 Tax=Caulobacter segnis TaxID=88688 RepID=A0A2W5WEX8_9CAUL|nr:glycosyltransferase [Caulobacter segnis]PZR32158.1 MAG: hypothetical protein DI526_17410 [Caulobacter segnis]